MNNLEFAGVERHINRNWKHQETKRIWRKSIPTRNFLSFHWISFFLDEYLSGYSKFPLETSFEFHARDNFLKLASKIVKLSSPKKIYIQDGKNLFWNQQSGSSHVLRLSFSMHTHGLGWLKKEIAFAWRSRSIKVNLDKLSFIIKNKFT